MTWRDEQAYQGANAAGGPHDNLRPDLEAKFVCEVCGYRGADVRSLGPSRQA